MVIHEAFRLICINVMIIDSNLVDQRSDYLSVEGLQYLKPCKYNDSLVCHHIILPNNNPCLIVNIATNTTNKIKNQASVCKKYPNNTKTTSYVFSKSLPNARQAR